MRQTELQKAFVLHTRAYRDTSMLLDIFTLHHGRLSLVARGVRNGKHRWRHLLMPFRQVEVTWSGNGELQTLTQLESQGVCFNLERKALFCGFYLNELLLYLLPKQDAYPEIFELYEHTLRMLKNKQQLEPCLRYFERHLLHILGYDTGFEFEAEPIMPEGFYLYRHEHGFVPVKQQIDATQMLYRGKVLLDIAKDNYTDEITLSQAKQLFRTKLQFLLGSKSIKSREMFV